MENVIFESKALPFGTDGVRGIANSQLTPEYAYKLGQAGGVFLRNLNPDMPVIIGMDTRLSGPLLEHALTAGLLSVGVPAWKAGIVPTPAVAYLVKTLNLAGGVVISASHNPARYNGIKFFGPDGYKLEDQQEEAIQRLVYQNIEKAYPAEIGHIQEDGDLHQYYLKHLLDSAETDFRNLKLAIDCANGACFDIGPKLFRELEAVVEVFADQPDGLNINENCGSTHMDTLRKRVMENGFDAGLAFDGDGDRVLAVDEQGNLIDGDQILRLCALHLREKERLPGNKVVGTVMSNLGLEVALKEAGIEVTRSNVGDRYVLDEMKKTGANLGGEQSGHVIFLDRVTTGDGLLTALELLTAWKHTGKPLSEAAAFKRYPQVLLNVEVEDRGKLSGAQGLWSFVKDMEDQLSSSGRILLRPSGTEPLVRVMVEAESEDSAVSTANKIADKVIEEIGGNIRG